MAYIKNGFAMKSRPRPADDDVILIQSDDDDSDSDEVVLVSDTDSCDSPFLSNCPKKSLQKRSQQRKKVAQLFFDLPTAASRHNDLAVTNGSGFSSAISNAAIHALLNSKTARTSKVLDRSSLSTLNVQKEGNGLLAFENPDMEFDEAVLANTLGLRHEKLDRIHAELSPTFDDYHELNEKGSHEETVGGLESLNEPSDELADIAAVAVNQEDLTLRDEVASLADADVSLLSNISFCSDLSSDLPADLPSALAGELDIDLASDLTSLTTGLTADLDKPTNLECDLPLESMNSCLDIAHCPQHILDDLKTSCQNYQSVRNCCEVKNSAAGSNLLQVSDSCLSDKLSGLQGSFDSRDLSEIRVSCSAEHLCAMWNTCTSGNLFELGDSCENSCDIRKPCSTGNICDTENPCPAISACESVSRNIGATETSLATGNLFGIENPHPNGNLLEIEILKELGNPLEISRLCAIDSLQEFQSLPEIETEVEETPEAAIYLEDKDLEVDLSSTFIKNVLNLNVGEAIPDVMAEPFNFSSIVSDFDSLISVASHLPVSLNSSLSFPQDPQLSCAPSLPIEQHLPLPLVSSNSFSMNSDLSSALFVPAQHLLSSSAFPSFPEIIHDSGKATPELTLNISENQEFFQTPFEKLDGLSKSGTHQILVESEIPCSLEDELSACCRDPASSLVEEIHCDTDGMLCQASFPEDKMLSISGSSKHFSESHPNDSMLYTTQNDCLLSNVKHPLKQSVPVMCVETVCTNDNISLSSAGISVSANMLNSASDSLYVTCKSLPSMFENSLAVLDNLASASASLSITATDSLPTGSSVFEYQKNTYLEDTNQRAVPEFFDNFNEKHVECLSKTSSFLAVDVSDGFTDKICVKGMNDFNRTVSLNTSYMNCSLTNAGALRKDQNHNITDSGLLKLTESDAVAERETEYGNCRDKKYDEIEDDQNHTLLDVKKNEVRQLVVDYLNPGKRRRNEQLEDAEGHTDDLVCKRPRIDGQLKEGSDEHGKSFQQVKNKLDENWLEIENLVVIEESQDCKSETDKSEKTNIDSNKDFQISSRNIDGKFTGQNMSNSGDTVESASTFIRDPKLVIPDFTETNQSLYGEGSEMEDSFPPSDENETISEESYECDDDDDLEESLDVSKESDESENDIVDEIHDVSEESGKHDKPIQDQSNESKSSNLEQDSINIEDRYIGITDKILDQDIDMSKLDEASTDVDAHVSCLSEENGDLEKGFLDLNEDLDEEDICNVSDVAVKTNEMLGEICVNSVQTKEENHEASNDSCILKNHQVQDVHLSNSNQIKDINEPPKSADDSVLKESVNDVIKMSEEPVDISKAKCFNCLKDIVKSVLAYCTAGHGCCSSCLHGQVKAFLATSSKSPFSCQFKGCSSFYMISQLRSSLPKMVVDILEEKLEREYSDSTAQLLMKMNGIQEVNNDTDEEQENMEQVYSLRTSLVESMEDRDSFELPSGWKEMNPNEEFKLVEINSDSKEFMEVSELFNRTMLKSRATILRLQRLQNPVLWEFYTVKKKQKEMEGVDKKFFEQLLFHGIRQEFLDTICLNNFDWRTCGVSHGIMYGQGTYFARDASYAHRYTDRIPSSVKQPLTSQLDDTVMLDDAVLGSESDFCETSTTDFGPFLHSSVSCDIKPEHQSLSKDFPLAEKSATPDWEKHMHLMFLARVIVGKYTRGKRTYRKPPPIDIFVPYGKCYDSCVNYVDDPSLFVIFDSSQYYPEYLIHYTNKPKTVECMV